MGFIEILCILQAVIILLMIWLAPKYFSSYVIEKGKNMATKEDIKDLTKLMEDVRHDYVRKIEYLKSDLNNEFHIIERRRRVYEEICNSLRVFIHGNQTTSEQKEAFLSAYSSAWLWASDKVLSNLNLFVDIQIKHAKKPSNNDGFTMECIYRELILAMRQDVGFIKNGIDIGEFKFVYF